MSKSEKLENNASFEFRQDPGQTGGEADPKDEFGVEPTQQKIGLLLPAVQAFMDADAGPAAFYEEITICYTEIEWTY